MGIHSFSQAATSTAAQWKNCTDMQRSLAKIICTLAERPSQAAVTALSSSTPIQIANR
ncbi:hypothetical protein [Halomicronema sp. CCY15110]|uniref:hypothetical protein n=1 Tax=Halomicronema sp. CCY15110 TaxID=2767773 RepID=UPI00194DF8A9|nr:hypothetical protein [Halomicronema sp. CCY15110]